MNVKVETVYGASKFLEKIADAPASVTVVTAEEIERYGYRTLADVLRSVRGFYVIYDRNYTYVGVRGFSQPGDYNARILFLVDGHRDNDNIFDGAYVGTEFPVDIDLIDHVEIIRGPDQRFTEREHLLRDQRDYETRPRHEWVGNLRPGRKLGHV